MCNATEKRDTVIEIGKRALADNEARASRLRENFDRAGTLVVNLISSPGSGKTTLLEATLGALGGSIRCGVLEGDVATERDAERIRATGVPAHQILTGGACHLDARLVEKGLDEAAFPELDILFIENVGNLICPTNYDLGEDFKTALLSVTEGDDKPFKYPAIFSRAAVTVITKSDMLPHLPFDLDAVTGQLETLNPSSRILLTSSVTGEGIDSWCELLRDRLEKKRAAAG